MRLQMVIGTMFVIFASGCGGDSAQPMCGNGVCEAGETSGSCCNDCGCSGGAQCQSNVCVAPMMSTGPVCGNGRCESGESMTGCCQDCGCPSGESCMAGSCKAVCKMAGDGCSTDTDCCTGNHCIDFGGVNVCQPSCTSNSGCSTNCCTTATNGLQICAPTSYCMNQALGAPCTANNECTSGLCVNGGSGQGWCSKTCTRDTDCPNSPYFMWCVQNSGGSNICFTDCTANSDCASYGPSSACQPTTTASGSSEHVCAG